MAFIYTISKLFLETVGKISFFTIKVVVANEFHNFLVVYISIYNDNWIAFIRFGNYGIITIKLFSFDSNFSFLSFYQEMYFNHYFYNVYIDVLYYLQPYISYVV